MTEKFKNIPLDPDTHLISTFETKFSEHDCVYQIWVYDSIRASSLIFYKNDIKDLSYEELENLLRTSSLMSNNTSEITISSISDDYTFINFNFEYLD